MGGVTVTVPEDMTMVDPALIDTVGGYDLSETIIPEGENVYGNAFIEFYLDQSAMQRLAKKICGNPDIKSKDTSCIRRRIVLS